MTDNNLPSGPLQKEEVPADELKRIEDIVYDILIARGIQNPIWIDSTTELVKAEYLRAHQPTRRLAEGEEVPEWFEKWIQDRTDTKYRPDGVPIPPDLAYQLGLQAGAYYQGAIAAYRKLAELLKLDKKMVSVS